MRSIAGVQSSNRELNQTQENIKLALAPVLTNALVQGAFLKDVALNPGTNTIAHGLNRTQQGWLITDTNGTASVYRSASFNANTLTLTSSGSVSVTLYVF